MVEEFLRHCVTGPNLPPTVLLGAVLLYGVIALVGLLDLDLFDFDLDLDVDGDIDIFANLGFVTLRFFNLGRLPVMIWVGVFGLCWWTVSMLLWLSWDVPYEPSWWAFTQLVVRNVFISVFITKFLTKPLVPVFDRSLPYQPQNLIGKECEVSTYEATPQSGQAKYKTDGAPLLLNVRTEVGTLAKGDRAVIVDFDSEKRVYLITPVMREVQE